MREKIPCVYMIRNKINDKKYIGITGDYLHRRQCHISCLNKKKHSNIHLQRAWNKYGADNFEFLIVEVVAEKELLPDKEIYWIGYFDSCKNGYNQTFGGDGTVNVKFPPERGQKISKALKGRKYPELSGKNAHNARKIICLDTGEIFEFILDAANKIGINDSAVINSCKYRKAICDNKYVFMYYNEYEKLSSYEIEQIKNNAHDNYGHKTPQNAKEVICLNTLERFTDGCTAAKITNTEHSYLMKCCKGLVASAGKDKTGNGLAWMTLDDYEVASDIEIENRLQAAYKSAKHNIPIKVKCLTTDTVFDSLAHATREYKLNSQCMLKRHLYSDGIYGNHPETNEKLVWELVS